LVTAQQFRARDGLETGDSIDLSPLRTYENA
jgi:hypothetical protein